MKSLKIMLVLLVGSMAISSCSKDDTTAPVITITAPAEGAILDKGINYPLVGTVTDNEELAEIDAGGVKITTFDSKTSHVIANVSLNIATTEASGPRTITVTATDKAGNKATKVVNFTIR